MAPVSVARPQQRADQMPALAVEDHEWVVHMLTVVAMVGRAFLISVCGIIGRIEIQEDLPRSAVLAPLPKIEFEECLGHPVAAAHVGRILQAADGRLAGEIRPALGQRAAHHLEQGIFPQRV